MSKTSADIQKELQAMFEPCDIEWRVQQAGIGKNSTPWVMAIPYITSRAVQTRLDEVMGFGKWRNEFREVKDGMLCGLSLFIDGEWLTKWDGAPDNPMHKVKGVVSDSTKRAAVQWGIGRYLYQLDVCFANCMMVQGRRDSNNNFHTVKGRNGAPDQHIDWVNPSLPQWAIPQQDLSAFIGAMNSAETMEELSEAFSIAYKYFRSCGDSDMEGKFIKCKDENKERINKDLTKIMNSQFEKVSAFISEQIAAFNELPTASTLNNMYKLSQGKLKEECAGKLFKEEQAFELLKQGYETRLKSFSK